jgi:ribonuclease P protein component
MLYTVKIVANITEKKQKNPLYMAFFVIKKKTFKKAVDRNRVKRRARKAFLDAYAYVEKKYPSLFNILQEKRIIFFLERDMIQELYTNVVSKMMDDLIRVVHTYTK